MLHPTDHAALLARRDFVPPVGDFSPAEREILTKFGRWLEALADGTITPTTPGQEQFVQVARSQREPETEFERVWVQVIKYRELGIAVTRVFQELAQARANRASVEEEYAAVRSAVLAQLKEQLAAVDEAFAARLAEATEAAATAEATVREMVLRVRRNVSLAGIRATYSAPRVSWDTPKLEMYAEAHPEVRLFRKVGKPVVALRFMDKAAGGPSVPLPQIDDPNEPEPL